jgi:hypothetical protein
MNAHHNLIDLIGATPRVFKHSLEKVDLGNKSLTLPP